MPANRAPAAIPYNLCKKHIPCIPSPAPNQDPAGNYTPMAAARKIQKMRQNKVSEVSRASVSRDERHPGVRGKRWNQWTKRSEGTWPDDQKKIMWLGRHDQGLLWRPRTTRATKDTATKGNYHEMDW